MAKKTTTSIKRQRILDLPIHLDAAIRNQSERTHAALRLAIVDGRLKAGFRLPSSRDLAVQLGVNRNAVVAAYEHLAADGLLEARSGSGTYIARLLPVPQPACAPDFEFVPPRRRAFALGHTFADEALLRRMAGYARRRIVGATTSDLGYGDPRGSACLRAQIAQHISVNRGVQCDPARILIVPGIQQALRLCADALFPSGGHVWVEDPGYFATHATLRAAGLNLVPVPVDAQGFDVAAARNMKNKVCAAYVTPSHQFPSGVVMSMRRRIALIDWARSNGSWILEDDYDSEFRYAGPPLTALAGIAGERVIYMGTFTKTLFAGLRMAYLVVPSSIVERVAAARATFDRGAPAFMQDTVADLIAHGELSAHIRRMRLRYQGARDVVVTHLGETAGGALTVREPEQGLHLVAELPGHVSRQDAMRILELADVEARLLSETRLSSSGNEGFILGFSGFTHEDLQSAARRLGAVTRKIARQSR